MTTQHGTFKGGWTGFQAFAEDDAAAKAATIELINILDTVEVPIVVVRRDLRICCFNKAADVLGLSPSDIGRASRDVSVLAALPRLEQQCSQVIAGGLESRVDFRQGEKQFVIRISPYTQGDHEVTGTVLTFSNVTAFRASMDQAIYERECTKVILNTVADPLVVLSADQRIQSGNRSFYAMFGVSRDKTQGVSLYEFGNAVFELDALRQQLNEMLAGSHAFQSVEVDHVFTAKGQRTLILDAHPLSFPGHSERRVLVTFQDITERKQAEAAKDLRSEEDLRRSEAKIRRLVEANVVGIVIFNLEGAIIEANDAFLRMVQYSREDLASGRVRWTELTPAEWRDRDEQAIVELNVSRIFRPFEKEYLRKDGSRVPVLLGGALFEEGRNEGVAFILDLSEQKRAERALRRSEAFLAEGQRLGRIGSFSWRVATDEITWSEQLYRIYELEVGMPVTVGLIRTRVHPEDRSLYEKMVEQARNGGNDFEWQYRLLMPDQSIKYLHAVAHATRDENGQLEYIAAIQDVTERRRSEEALDNARSELAQVARAMSLGTLTASITHEVRQPLAAAVTNAKTCSRWLGRDEPDVAEAREAISRLLKDLTRASEIISRIGSLFKKSAPKRELVDVNEAVEEMIALLRGEARTHSISVQSSLASDLPLIMADRVQLQQVLMNLMLNGIDSMKGFSAAGKLTITSRRDENGQVLISIADTGVGVRPEQTEQIFTPFFTSKAQGTGMGLTISRSIVESHGGRLWATPHSGPGATFQFTLPIEGAEHRAA